MSRVAQEATAFGNRGASFLLNLVGATPTPAAVAAVDAAIAAVERAVSDCGTGGRYLNFLDGAARRRHASAGLAPGAVERIAGLKAELDPYGLFAHGLEPTAPAGEVADRG